MENVKNKKLSLKVFLLLQLLLAVVSFCGVFSKLAAGVPMFSFRFFLYYGGLLFLLAVNAIFWQQIIKRLPLTIAYANRAIGIIWGMIWSRLVFGDVITPKKIIGAAIVIVGIVLYSVWGSQNEQE